MRIVLAIDSFKGSMTSMEAASAAKEGILSVCPHAEVIPVPIADGGEGTVEALVSGMGGEVRTVTVHGPLLDPVSAPYGFLPESNTAIIEMAAASGLVLVPKEKRNPTLTTTYGVGELIRHAIESGARHFIIGIGGSATHDCGVGMLQALGWRFSYKDGICSLSEVEFIDKSGVLPALSECTFRIACDVTNPLCGETGAASVYSPQKGADEAMVKALDGASLRFAELYTKTGAAASPFPCGALHTHPGAGAAGGLGFAFLGFLGGELCSGIRLIMEETGLEEKIIGSDLVITGEGRIDAQTSMGKAPAGVAELGKKHGVPVFMVAGGCKNVSAVNGFPCFSVLRGPMTLDEAMKAENAKNNMRETAAAITAAALCLGKE
ncbi:MAG: glycerate kinase [Ruminococcaceae bacterium]|nr:glycerate kinase [Oscillospiraceae bacterium]